MLRIALILIGLVALSAPALAQEVNVRVKDAASFRLSGGDVLQGQGLVIGLAGTGDDNDAVAKEMLRASTEAALRLKTDGKYTDESFSAVNVARVLVKLRVESGEGTAGNKLSATVSIISEATSLRGGELMVTDLLNSSDATDATIYARAEGPIRIPVMPGANAAADAPNGTVDAALVEDIPEIFYTMETNEFGEESYRMTLQLNKASTTNANAIARAINNDPNILGLASTVAAGEALADAPRVAKAEGSGRVEITVPEKWHDELMEFREIVENASFPAEVPAEVIINMQSGVITIANTVRFSPGTIIAAGVTIQLGANGQLPPETQDDAGNPAPTTDPAVPLTAASRNVNDELMQTLNVLNLTMQEKAEVFNALERAGMLHGDLIFVR